MSDTEYRSDYPSVPIGGSNPYWMCAHCKLSDPQINMDVKGHHDYCAWRIWVEAGEQGDAPPYQVWIQP